MPEFTSKMRRLQFRPGLCPDPAGELTALPGPIAGGEGPSQKKPRHRLGSSGIDRYPFSRMRLLAKLENSATV